MVEWPIVIHSYIPHGVLLSDALRDGELLGREHKCFEVRPVAAMEIGAVEANDRFTDGNHAINHQKR